jgi:hypothetical protein
MRINEHQKKRCDKDVDSKGIPFKLKLCAQLKNKTECVHLVKGGNVLKYKTKINALSKPRAIALQLH